MTTATRILLGFVFAQSCARAELSLACADALTRFSRQQEVPQQGTIHLEAARGEWEPFQIVVRGTPQEVKGLVLEAVPLHGPGKATLPAPVVLREHYVRVTQSTPMSPLPPGEYPDALVPQDFPWQELEGEKVNQPFWVDVFVPYATPPGRYEGRVVLSGAGQEVTVSVEVLDFDLPVVPRLRTSFMTIWRRIARVHGFADEEPLSAELAALLDRYYELLAQHRISIDAVYGTYPDFRTGKLNESAVEAAMRKHLLHRHASTLGLPIWPEWPFADPLGKDRAAAQGYVAQWMKLLHKFRCGTRGYIIMGHLDEPNNAAAYADVRRWGDFFNEAEHLHKVRLPLLITEQPTPDDGWWGRLDGDVDIWVPHFSSVWQDMEAPDAPRDIARRLKAGDEVWTYAALVQIPDAWLAAHGNPQTLKEGHPPVWALDFPPMNHRIIGWLLPLHGITGLTYWDTLHVHPGINVWENAGSFRGDDGVVFNGDGSYLYPATRKHHGRDEPVASLRLKWLRESAEDYDRLMLAHDIGLQREAREITAAFARGFGDWKDDPQALMQARQKLGALILAAQRKGGKP